MKNILKKINSVSEHKGLVESFLSLSVLNAINLILPLITLPYLVKTVGLSNYGAYSIVYTTILTVLSISSYGFNYSTTKQIAQNKDNLNRVQVIFFSTIYARVIISIPAVILGLIFITYSYKSEYILMYIGGLGIIIGDIINPVWLFQGYEKMRYMTFANLTCKILFTVLIFMFVTSKDDYVFITFWNSAGFIAAGLLSLLISFRIFNLKIIKVPFREIFFQIKEGWSIFLSTIFMNVYRNMNVLLLGLFVSEASVGVYSTAEKVIKAIQSATTPISNALFPYLSSSFKDKSAKECSIRILSINKKVSIILIFVSLLSIAFSGFINSCFFGNTDERIAELICYMSPTIFIGGMNYILGIAGLVNINRNRFFLMSVTISGVLSIIILVVFVHFIDLYSAALAMISAEIILFILCYNKLKGISKR